MVLYQGIRATIKRHDDDEPYREYKIPNSPRSGRGKEVYIEAVSGERFYVLVEVATKFDFKSSKDVQIEFEVDNEEKEAWCVAKATLRQANHFQRSENDRSSGMRLLSWPTKNG